MEKVVLHENTLYYINPSYLIVKKNKEIYYCDFFILWQIVESSNPPQDISSYTLKENKVKIVRPKYNPKQVNFRGCTKLLTNLLLKVLLRRYSSITAMTVKNQKCFIHITEREFQTLFLGPYLIVIERWLKLKELRMNVQIFIFPPVHNGQIGANKQILK